MSQPPRDMSPAEFRAAAHRAADLAADYFENLEQFRVLPEVVPGFLRDRIPAAPPEQGEPLEPIFAQIKSLIEPGLTHWQHPGFMAYFSSSAPGIGVLGEWLASTYNSNVMFWRNAPASTELEEVVVSWLRQMLGLPESFDGMLTDTASISTLLSLIAARQLVPGLEAREEGLAGRAGIGRLRIYCSEEAHSSTEKAAIVAGIGRRGVRKIATDAHYALRPELLAAAVREDRQGGWWPVMAVGMIGTTSSTAIDPIPAIAAICQRESLWLHVDAAYAGPAAIVPELRPLFAGWEQADSIVINPHKWMMTPFDASLLLTRRMETLREAMSLMPEYLKVRQQGEAHNYHEYGIQLGRRFRALKLWMQIRHWGVTGIADRLREHVRLAQLLARWIESEPGWELLAPTPFSTVCFRNIEGPPATWNQRNEQILERVNQSGRVFLSHTKLAGTFTLRVALGNVRQELRHVEECWQQLRRAAAALDAMG